MSYDTGAVDVGLADSTPAITGDLAFTHTSPYLEFAATNAAGTYTFTFKNAGGDALASFDLDPLRRGREVVFKNISLALIGRVDDGEGNSTLRGIQINNF